MSYTRAVYSYKVEFIPGMNFFLEDQLTEIAIVSLIDINGNLVDTRQLPVLPRMLVYKAMNKGLDIDISGFFIQNFSLVEYREEFGFKLDARIDINNFKADFSVFEASEAVDFSLVNFHGKETTFKNTHFGIGNVIFDRTNFENKIVNFSKSSFSEGAVSFKYTNFGNGVVSFENTVFRNGDISFLNSFFNDGLINFKNVDFGDGDVSFHYSEFGDGDVIFHRSKFNAGLVDFSKVNFGEGKVDFRHCDFKDSEVSFEEIDHKNNRILFKRDRFGNRKISFNKSEIQNSEIIFDEAEFGDGSLTFNGALCSRISLKNCILSNYLDLRVDTCRIIDLSDSIVQNLVDLERGNTSVNLDRLYIYGVRILGKIFISWENNNIKKIIGEQHETSYDQKMDQYRILKEVFHSTGQYEDEDRAYVEFKRNELLAKVDERKEEGGIRKPIGYVGYGLKKAVFDWVGLYATSPGRVLISIFLVYGAYSVLYVLFELSGHGAISCITPGLSIFEKVIDSFYFSAVTFLTIGYGDCTPTGIFKVIAPFEGWMGVFMMSYFTVAFARKILR